MRRAILLIAIFLLAGCVGQTAQEVEKETARTATDVVADAEELTVTTTDNVKIAASYYKTEGDKGIILIHALGHDKSSWKEFAPELQKAGYSVMAIDLRGHGGSELNWRSFLDSDFNKMMFDLIAAGNYLKGEGKTKIGLIGASIGANLAVFYANTEDAKTTVLLSPGLNYRGVNIQSTITQLAVPSIILVGDQDTYSANSVKTISEVIDIPIKMYPTNAHGTDLLNEGDVKQVIVDWLKEYLK